MNSIFALHLRNVKSNLISILLFLCLFAPLTGAFVMLRVQKSLVRREVKHMLMRKINKEELVLIKVSKTQHQNELEWKHSKEFKYKGEMYDIVSVEQHGDSTWYYCWVICSIICCR